MVAPKKDISSILSEVSVFRMMAICEKQFEINCVLDKYTLSRQKHG